MKLKLSFMQFVGALGFLIGLSPSSVQAMGPRPTNRLIVAMGDSITAGTLANTTSTPFVLQAREPLVRSLATEGTAGAASADGSGLPSVEISDTSSPGVSDELSGSEMSAQNPWLDLWKNLSRKGLIAMLSPFIYNRATYSWVTGRLIDSHDARIRRFLGAKHRDRLSLKTLNFAVPGSVASGLVDQATRLAARIAQESAPGGASTRIEYLAMTIGANDSCRHGEEGEADDLVFESDMRRALEVVAEAARAVGHSAAEPVRVLVSAIPPIPTIGARNFWRHEIVPGITCEKMRTRLFPYCHTLLRWNGEEEFLARMEVVHRKNAILKELFHELNEAHPELQIVFGDSVASVKLAPKDLAIDCFHPNLSGQKRLSEQLWRDQPWY